MTEILYIINDFNDLDVTDLADILQDLSGKSYTTEFIDHTVDGYEDNWLVIYVGDKPTKDDIERYFYGD